MLINKLLYIKYINQLQFNWDWDFNVLINNSGNLEIESTNNLIDNSIINYYIINANFPFLHSIKSGIKRAKLTNNEKNLITLTPIQIEILIGCILGDASLERRLPTHNTRLRFDQTFPEHAPYVMYLYSIFYYLTGSSPSINIRKPDPRTNKIYSSMSFKTLSLPCLNFYHDLFYDSILGKIIPSNIENYLTPRSLAFWIMDDGSKDSNGQTILHTRSYSYSEILLLQNTLKNKFNLRTRITEKTSGQFIIHIPVKQDIRLKNIVLPYMHYTFIYKV